jgi:hypothetical protein
MTLGTGHLRNSALFLEAALIHERIIPIRKESTFLYPAPLRQTVLQRLRGLPLTHKVPKNLGNPKPLPGAS